jgi:hypothetical protein
MAGLLIKFAIRLGDSVDFSGGPLFHRWLPRGMEDAIELEPVSAILGFGLKD